MLMAFSSQFKKKWTIWVILVSGEPLGVVGALFFSLSPSHLTIFSLYVEMKQLGVSNGDSLQFEQDGNATLVMNGDSQAAIADENNVVDNGIVHVLDSVLVPSSFFFSPTPGECERGDSCRGLDKRTSECNTHPHAHVCVQSRHQHQHHQTPRHR